MASEMENPFLPFEIITNILTRLPIKSIVKFQCVCKQWKNLFKTQSFISQNTLHTSHQNPFLLIHAYDPTHHRSTLRLLDHDNMEVPEVVNTTFIDSFTRSWRIIGSSNGLLCVELAAENGSRPISHLVWNPMSNEVKEIPNIVDDYGDAAIVGFGYSSVIDDYKMVRFYNPDLLSKKYNYRGTLSLYCVCVQVYSLSTGSWKELEMGDLRYVEISPEATIVNGTIFWCGFWVPFEVVFAFDIATEVFTITPIDRLFSGDMNSDECEHCPYWVYEYGNKLALCDAIRFVDDELKACDMYFSVIEADADESGKRLVVLRDLSLE